MIDIIFIVISGNLWCGYSQEWTSSYSKISFSSDQGYRAINNQTDKHQGNIDYEVDDVPDTV